MQGSAPPCSHEHRGQRARASSQSVWVGEVARLQEILGADRVFSGLTASLIFTLFLVPVLYDLMTGRSVRTEYLDTGQRDT